jgi:hypothetical protein
VLWGNLSAAGQDHVREQGLSPADLAGRLAALLSSGRRRMAG